MRGRESSARAFGEGVFAASNLEAVTAVDGLDVEDLSTRDAEDALHWRRHVLVHSIRELDDNDRALAGCSYQPARDGARALSELTENHFHIINLASTPRPSTARYRE